MKYAFVIGSNVFIVPVGIINYIDDGAEKEFLRINSIYHDLPAATASLDIDLNFTDDSGTQVILLSNKAVTNLHFKLLTEPDNIQVLKQDGSTIIQVHQLMDDVALGLEHNISAELEAQAPVVVIRLTGHFFLGGLHILAENEKLFVNEIGYAGSVLNGAGQLAFSVDGVVL